MDNKNKDIKNIVKQIRNKEIKDFSKVPKELWLNPDIVKAERKAKLRTLDKRGFDVIRQRFFVCELVQVINMFQEYDYLIYKSEYESFDDFYSFVDGDIYSEACYYGYSFSKKDIKEYSIDESRLNFKSLENDTIDDCIPNDYIDDEEFAAGEKKKTNIKKWLNKYLACRTYMELLKVNEQHSKSKDDTDSSFYLWNYINIKGEDGFDPIMKLVNHGWGSSVEYALPFVYGQEAVLRSYNYSSGSKSTCAKHTRKMKEVIRSIEENTSYNTITKYFDKEKHYYCIRLCYYYKVDDSSRRFPYTMRYVYFEHFEDFANYLEKDLSDCDLSYARNINIDASYKTNENTKMPVVDLDTLERRVTKLYDRKQEKFIVSVKWVNQFGNTIFSKEKRLQFFFDFLAYLKNDLSGAELLFCEGLKNIKDFSGIKIDNAMLTSEVLDILGVSYSVNKDFSVNIETFEKIIENEKETALILNSQREELAISSTNVETDEKIYYITDLHLAHKIERKKARNKADVVVIIQKIVDKIIEDLHATFFDLRPKILLIGGDISSEYSLFELFIKILRDTIVENRLSIKVFFVLGNHEFWNQEGKSVNEIVSLYRELIEANGMYLLENELMFLEDDAKVGKLLGNEILDLNEEVIRSKLRKARIIILGGVGFAGYNEDFNANNGIYRKTIDRAQEISLSKEFEALYNRVIEVLGNRKIIVFTHMNINEWKAQIELHGDYVYVSGHSHRNAFYDNGTSRLYADNQIGYYNDNPRLKFFYLDNTYDWFSAYEDGIYEISRENYIEFYRGKNLEITFNREFAKLFMLKKHEYYCFIMQNKSGKLTMLNGGALKALSHNNINYYYANMDVEINYIKAPLLKYQAIQEQISSEIKKIGGSGRIHGAIIDVDRNPGLFGWDGISYNHVYVNPMDLSITPYYAVNTVVKYVYPSFPALIHDKCPELLDKYRMLLAEKGEHSGIVKTVDKDELMVKPQLYLDTDIYKASRELRKMQKLNSGILSTWMENIPSMKMIPDIKHESGLREKRRKEQQLKQAQLNIGKERMMDCGMKATIIEYVNYEHITVQFEDGTVVKSINKYHFDRGKVWNPNIPRQEKVVKERHYRKASYVGKTQIMNCGMKATVIEDFGCNDITIQFEDGLIRKHIRRDKFRLGKVAHVRN